MSIEFLTPMFLVTTQSGEFISCICHYFSFALWHCPGSGGIHRSSRYPVIPFIQPIYNIMALEIPDYFRQQKRC